MPPNRFWPDFPRYIREKHVDPQGNVQWPDDESERIKLARAVFGKVLSTQLDFELGMVTDYLENSEPKTPFRRKNEIFEEDKYLRKSFSTLTTPQRRAVRSLVQQAVYGVLHSLLVSIDQPDPGESAVIFMLRDPESTALANMIPLLSGEDDLHDCLCEWLLSFSQYGKEMVEYSWQGGDSWELGPKLAHRKVQADEPDLG